MVLFSLQLRDSHSGWAVPAILHGTVYEEWMARGLLLAVYEVGTERRSCKLGWPQKETRFVGGVALLRECQVRRWSTRHTAAGTPRGRVDAKHRRLRDVGIILLVFGTGSSATTATPGTATTATSGTGIPAIRPTRTSTGC